MARPRKAWSKSIEEAGITVRIYERSPGSLLYREIRRESGGKDRKSLNHRDRRLAEQQARELARRVFELRNAGGVIGLTVGGLFALYELHQLPLLSPPRQQVIRRTYLPYFRAILVDGFLVQDISQATVDAYASARRSKALRSERHRGVSTAPRDGTIRSELNWLKSVLRWATMFRRGGRPLLTSNPMLGLDLPREKNVRRPVSSEDRFQRTIAIADVVDRYGRLACMLAFARFTGRRINAICNLRAADVLLTRDQILRALAARGLDERQADFMPHGAIAWPAETDKQGFEEITAISSAMRAALDRYMRLRPRVGTAWLFPDLKTPGRAITRAAADHLLRRAEERANLAKLERGMWHPYRRAWASERKHLPDVDTAKAGGWRDTTVMKASYQQPDPATMLRVIENTSEPVRENTDRGAAGH